VQPGCRPAKNRIVELDADEPPLNITINGDKRMNTSPYPLSLVPNIPPLNTYDSQGAQKANAPRLPSQNLLPLIFGLMGRYRPKNVPLGSRAVTVDHTRPLPLPQARRYLMLMQPGRAAKLQQYARTDLLSALEEGVDFAACCDSFETCMEGEGVTDPTIRYLLLWEAYYACGGGRPALERQIKQLITHLWDSRIAAGLDFTDIVARAGLKAEVQQDLRDTLYKYAADTGSFGDRLKMLIQEFGTAGLKDGCQARSAAAAAELKSVRDCVSSEKLYLLLPLLNADALILSLLERAEQWIGSCGCNVRENEDFDCAEFTLQLVMLVTGDRISSSALDNLLPSAFDDDSTAKLLSNLSSFVAEWPASVWNSPEGRKTALITLRECSLTALESRSRVVLSLSEQKFMKAGGAMAA
jgi:hypothetical protein